MRRNEMKKKDREKSVSEIIEEVVVKICDDYCKYPDICKKEDDLMKICDECPLNRL